MDAATNLVRNNTGGTQFDKLIPFVSALFATSIVSNLISLIGLRSPVKLILISLLVPLGMWLVFYKMLKVNIPMGWLQFLKDLVDKI